MGASSAGAVVKHGGGICWVVVVGLWFWLWSRVWCEKEWKTMRRIFIFLRRGKEGRRVVRICYLLGFFRFDIACPWRMSTVHCILYTPCFMLLYISSPHKYKARCGQVRWGDGVYFLCIYNIYVGLRVIADLLYYLYVLYVRRCCMYVHTNIPTHIS